MKSFRVLSAAVAAVCLFATCQVKAQSYGEAVLYSFCNQADCADGFDPRGGLALDSSGNIYGTTYNGGDVNSSEQDYGTAFSLTPAGSFTLLHIFCSSTCTEGQGPETGLLLAASGNFYGTTSYGGSGAFPSGGTAGTIFELTPTGTVTPIYEFCSLANCADGANPNGPVVKDADGNWYGTTTAGGSSTSTGSGTAFKLSSTGTLTTLHAFCSSTNCVDGYIPVGPLVFGANGNLFGVTQSGGAYGEGTVFTITTAGTLTVLHSFCADQITCTDGEQPAGGLVLGADGNFYGLTSAGGTGNGTAFKITPTGTLTTIYTFCSLSKCADGSEPVGILVQDSEKNLYGTTESGGTAANAGTVFKLTEAGVLTTLYTFCPSANNCSDAKNPSSGVVLGANGAIYGVSSAGGANAEDGYGYGTVYAVAPATAKLAPKITFSASPSPMYVGQPVELSASISASSGTPTGNVTFFVGSTVLCTGTLANAVASCTVQTSTLPSGKYTVTASYPGNWAFNAASISGTSTLNPSPTALSISIENSTVTPPVTLTISAALQRTAAGATGAPSGTLSLYSGATALGNITYSSGDSFFSEAVPENLPPGTYPLIAKYPGDVSDLPSTSNTLDVTVTTQTQAILTVAPSPIPANTNFTITVQVKQEYLPGIPTGTVQIHFGPYDLGNFTLNSAGEATVQLSSSNYTAKTYGAEATYSGDAKDSTCGSGDVYVVLQ